MDKFLMKHLPEFMVERRRKQVEEYFCGTKEEQEMEVERSLVNQWKKVLFATIGFTLLILILIGTRQFTKNKNVIYREDIGGSEISEEFQLKKDKKKETYQIQVPAKIYTKKEKKQAFQHGFRYIEDQIKGKNHSLNTVETKLNLVKEIPNSLLTVHWDTDQNQVIDLDGNVYNRDIKEPLIVQIKVTLSYENEKQTRIFSVCIVPKKESQSPWAKAKRKIKEIEHANESNGSFQIPTKLYGIQIQKINGNENQIPLLSVLAIMMIGLLWTSDEEKQKKMMRESFQGSKDEYPYIISQFTLLLRAGVPVEGVIHNVAKKNQHKKMYVYQQMMRASRQLRLGRSQKEVLKELGNQLKHPCYMKLMTMLTRSLTRGSVDLFARLEEEEANAFLERKEIARRKGEKASTKLLFPMLLMLLVVLILLMFPAFLSFS